LSKKDKVYKVGILSHQKDYFLVRASSKAEACTIAWSAPDECSYEGDFNSVKAVAHIADEKLIEEYQASIIDREIGNSEQS
jgi:hypothetical protein